MQKPEATAARPNLIFRIPISPKASFYHQVELFSAALRRLGEPYSSALLQVVVGDDAEMGAVRAANRWSEAYAVEWHPVPSDLFAEHGYLGTADYRYHLHAPRGALVALMDADTIVARPFLEDFTWMMDEQPCIAGHMAHVPPPTIFAKRAVEVADVWPELFKEFRLEWPAELYRYSMDTTGTLPRIPAYYNFGFVVLNHAALALFREDILRVQRHLKSILKSAMRSQIAVTLISYAHGMIRRNLSAHYNAANDDAHSLLNQCDADQIKIIHYLRTREVDRNSFLNPGERRTFLTRELVNPVNQLLQRVVREASQDPNHLSPAP